MEQRAPQRTKERARYRVTGQRSYVHSAEDGWIHSLRAARVVRTLDRPPMMRLAHVIFMGLALLFVNYYIATHMLIVGLRGSLDYSYALALGAAVVGVNIFILSCLVLLARRPALAILPIRMQGWRELAAWLHLALICCADFIIFTSAGSIISNMQVAAEDPAGVFMFAHNVCLLLAFTFGLSALAHGLQSKLVKWLNPEASEK